jgi:hypothetical protein
VQGLPRRRRSPSGGGGLAIKETPLGLLVPESSKDLFSGATGPAAVVGGNAERADELLRPMVGEIQATGTIALTNAYQDVTGATLEITPDVPSKLLCTAIFGLEVVEGALLLEGLLSLDGVDQTDAVADYQPQQAGAHACVSTISVLSLPEAGHKYTVKMRAQKFPNEGSAKALSGLTRMLYQLVAA